MISTHVGDNERIVWPVALKQNTENHRKNHMSKTCSAVALYLFATKTALLKKCTPKTTFPTPQLEGCQFLQPFEPFFNPCTADQQSDLWVWKFLFDWICFSIFQHSPLRRDFIYPYKYFEKQQLSCLKGPPSFMQLLHLLYFSQFRTFIATSPTFLLLCTRWTQCVRHCVKGTTSRSQIGVKGNTLWQWSACYFMAHQRGTTKLHSLQHSWLFSLTIKVFMSSVFTVLTKL